MTNPYSHNYRLYASGGSRPFSDRVPQISNTIRHDIHALDTNYATFRPVHPMPEPIYNLDNPDMRLEVLSRPPTMGKLSFRFHAIPLGPPGANLSRFGRVEHECEDKLEIIVPSQRFDLANEIKQAWVCKYVEKGVECIMTLGPSMLNDEYEIVIERVYKKAKDVATQNPSSSLGYGQVL
ncbi:hypothetical protein F5B20DRAFT_551312 [Whalleya microplaca]|nr:hypothetical protein F5B20DRAFT_551312 [Whalleya microplaca]